MGGDTTWGLAVGTCQHGNQVRGVRVSILVLGIPSRKIIPPPNTFSRDWLILGTWLGEEGKQPARDKAPLQARTLAQLISPSLPSFSHSPSSLPLTPSFWDRPPQEKKTSNLSCHVQLLTSRCRAIGKTCFLLFIYLPLGQWKAPGLLSSS